jgi:hypothetical protein
MPDIKRIMALSDWLEFELEDTPEKIIDPPKIRLRIKLLDPMAAQDVPAGEQKQSSRMKETLIDSIREWDLTASGKPIPCTDAAKTEWRPFLELLLSSMLKEELDADGKGKPRRVLGWELFSYGADKGNFLKN